MSMFMVNLLKVSNTNKKQSEEEEMLLLSGKQANHDAHISRAHISTKFNLYSLVLSFVFRCRLSMITTIKSCI